MGVYPQEYFTQSFRMGVLSVNGYWYDGHLALLYNSILRIFENADDPLNP